MAQLSPQLLLGIGLLGGCLAADARPVEYVENNASSDQIALGFPVPSPVDTPDRFDGFRSYAGLIQNLAALSFTSPELSSLPLGRSLNGLPIQGFVFGQQTTGAPGMLQTGTVHAREWASPEVVAHIAERLVEGLDSNGIERYLAEHSSILLVPVINPDGFTATQRAATQTRVNVDPGGDAATPRDGRMRRKNLRDSDGQFDTSADALFGVDLNRNIGPFWGSSGRSSTSPSSIIYQGSSEASEPETQALQQAASWFEPQQLRLYIDTHSFGRVYFYNDTGNTRLTELTRQLVDKLRQVPPRTYNSAQEPSQQGIGANDEFFAYEFEVPSYTLELEPGGNQTAEYGGNPGVSHSGFILPESEIARVRNEAYAMALLAYYHQAGPPALLTLSLYDTSDDSLVYQARWQTRDSSRALQVSPGGPLQPGREYRMQAQFDKPMRLLDEQNQPQAYPGQPLQTPPVLRLHGENATQSLAGAGHWQSSTYTGDTYVTRFTVERQLGRHARLGIAVRDLAGLALDANPASLIGWSDGHWTGYEASDGTEGDRDGEDRQICLPLSTDASTDCQAAPHRQGGGSGPPGLWLFALCALFRRYRTT